MLLIFLEVVLFKNVQMPKWIRDPLFQIGNSLLNVLLSLKCSISQYNELLGNIFFFKMPSFFCMIMIANAADHVEMPQWATRIVRVPIRTPDVT